MRISALLERKERSSHLRPKKARSRIYAMTTSSSWRRDCQEDVGQSHTRKDAVERFAVGQSSCHHWLAKTNDAGSMKEIHLSALIPWSYRERVKILNVHNHHHSVVMCISS